QGRGAAAAGDRVAGTHVVCHRLFERLHARALREPSAGDHLADSFHLFLPQHRLRDGNHGEYSCHCLAAIACFRHSTRRRRPSSRPTRARNPSSSAAFETSASRRGTGFTARSGRNSGSTSVRPVTRSRASRRPRSVVSVPDATLKTSSLTSLRAASTFARALSSLKTKSMEVLPSPKIFGRSPLSRQSSQRINTSVYLPNTSIRGPY